MSSPVSLYLMNHTNISNFIKEEKDRFGIEIVYDVQVHSGYWYCILIFKSDEDRNLYRLAGRIKEGIDDFTIFEVR